MAHPRMTSEIYVQPVNAAGLGVGLGRQREPAAIALSDFGRAEQIQRYFLLKPNGAAELGNAIKFVASSPSGDTECRAVV